MSAAQIATGRWRAVTLLAALAMMAFAAGACSSDDASSTDASNGGTEEATDPGDESSPEAGGEFSGTLSIGAIPDQEPERLQRTYDSVADYLMEAVPGITVEYVPVTDYQASVSGFRVGDLDLVWFGGLTGVQARLEVEGANAVVQRDIDAEFTSVFAASTDWLDEAGLTPDDFNEVADLARLEGSRFTFGSESSTSGRLMPQSFLEQAGVDTESAFDGVPGFSGSHDATIEQIAAGTFQTGALNSQVWDSRTDEGTIDEGVVEIFRTPTYYDYHWVARPDVDDQLGEGALDAIIDALIALDASDPAQAEILELFGAGGFITTENANYADIEAVGAEAGLINPTE